MSLNIVIAHGCSRSIFSQMISTDERYTEFKEIYSRVPKTMSAGTCRFDFKEGTNRIIGYYTYIDRAVQFA